MMKIIIAMLVLCFSVSSYADTNYVWKGSPIDGPGTEWSNAFHTIQGAVDVAGSNDTVLVTNGVYNVGSSVTPGYNCANRLVITNNITVRSVKGPAVTIIDGSNSVRGVYMSAGLLTGFTIKNGQTLHSGDYNYDKSGGGLNLYGGSGIVANCVISSNTAYTYGGGNYYGTLNNCTLIGNTANSGGGGSYNGTLTSCTLNGNSAEEGGGSYNGTLNNCALIDNSAFHGGASYNGTLNNCTLSGNSAEDGGGSYNGTLNNSIIYYNTAENGNNWYSSAISYSCTTPLPSGDGNITNNPVMLSASHIATNSPCVGTGSASYSSGTDIDGDSWGNPPSMGCDEPLAPFSGELRVSVEYDDSSVAIGRTLSFGADIQGEVSSNKWTFGDGSVMFNQFYVDHSWSTTGDYPLVLTAWNSNNPNGIFYTVTIHVVEADYYVWKDSPADGPGTAWSNAFHTIQGAVEIADDNNAILVTNGVYDTGYRVTPGYNCTNRVVIKRDITVRSVHGPAVTIIDGSNSVRGVYMSAGLLSGFTIRNGHTLHSGDYNYDKSGGGLNLYGGSGIVANCVISSNTAYTYGGGNYYGTLNNCTLIGNTANSGGGGSYNGTLTSCTLNGNSAEEGGGSYNGTLNNCALIDNSAFHGGASYNGTLNNCTLSGNSAEDGGGSYNGTLNNSIIYYNTAENGNNWYSSAISYSCTTPLPSGSGNITNNPLFANQAESNFHLTASSPCIDTGTNTYAAGATDFDGIARKLDGDADDIVTVDMGCYEYVNAGADSDGDTMRDQWEIAYGLNPVDPADQNGNPDNDPLNNLQEFIADTDPNDSNDWFCVTNLSSNVPPELYFKSSSNRLYTLQGKTNLMSGVWTNIPGVGPRAGNGGTDWMADTNTTGKSMYYRLKVKLP